MGLKIHASDSKSCTSGPGCTLNFGHCGGRVLTDHYSYHIGRIGHRMLLDGGRLIIT